MFNETKGSMGMFSRAGKMSSTMNIILQKKEELLNDGTKKKVMRTKSNATKNMADIKRVNFEIKLRKKLN